MKLAKVVYEQARELAQVIQGKDRGVMSVVKDVARGWIRDAYLAGYEDGVADTRAALGEDRADTEKKIAEAARERVAQERLQTENTRAEIAREREERVGAARARMQASVPPEAPEVERETCPECGGDGVHDSCLDAMAARRDVS